jgi:hypothetical protein
MLRRDLRWYVEEMQRLSLTNGTCRIGRVYITKTIKNEKYFGCDDHYLGRTHFAIFASVRAGEPMVRAVRKILVRLGVVPKLVRFLEALHVNVRRTFDGDRFVEEETSVQVADAGINVIL